MSLFRGRELAILALEKIGKPEYDLRVMRLFEKCNRFPTAMEILNDREKRLW
jgi:hypothetical protein